MSATVTLTERDWQARVLDCAKVFGWRFYHSRPAMTGSGWRTALQGFAGFPDLVLLRPPRLLLVELKSETGRVSPEQSDWIAELSGVPGIEAVVWRPSDWPLVLATLSDGKARLAS